MCIKQGWVSIYLSRVQMFIKQSWIKIYLSSSHLVPTACPVSGTCLPQRLARANTILHFILLHWLLWPSDWPDEPSGDIISYLISPVCPPGVLRGSPIQTSQPAFMDTLFPPFSFNQHSAGSQVSWHVVNPGPETPPLWNYTQESNPKTYYRYFATTTISLLTEMLSSVSGPGTTDVNQLIANSGTASEQCIAPLK